MRILIEITGSTPLICNKFTDAAAEKASSGRASASSAAGRGTPLEIASAKIYTGTDGLPMIPQPNLIRSIIDGGRFHKAGKSQITTQKSSLMFSCFDIEGAEIKIIHKEPWRVDTRAVRIPATGGRILCHRPMFDDWKLRFTVELDTRILSMSLLREIVDDAGNRIGLGDFRPATKGPYGKFKVTFWRVVEESEEFSIAAE